MEDFLTRKQAIAIYVLFTIGTSSISGIAKNSKTEAWVVVIFSALAALPCYFVYEQLLRNYKGKNIYQICDAIFGIYIGKIFIIFFVFNGVYLTALLIRIVGEFIHMAGLLNTPLVAILGAVGILCSYILKKGLEVFGRTSEFFLAIIMPVSFLTLLLSIPISDYNNLFPILVNGTEKTIDGVVGTLAFPFAQSALLLAFFNKVKEEENRKKRKNIYYIGWVIVFPALLILAITSIAVIGSNTYSEVYFPVYVTIRRVSIGDFVQRIDLAFVAMLLIVSITKIIATAFSGVIGLQYLFKLNSYKRIVVPFSFLCIVLGLLGYTGLLEHEKFIDFVYIPYSIFMNILLPVFIYISHLVKSQIVKIRNNLDANKLNS